MKYSRIIQVHHMVDMVRFAIIITWCPSFKCVVALHSLISTLIVTYLENYKRLRIY